MYGYTMFTSHRKIYTGIFFIIGIVGSFVAWEWVRQNEYDDRYDRFKAVNQLVSNGIFRANRDIINNKDVARFIMTQQESLTKENFDTFTQLTFGEPRGKGRGIREIITSWNPRVENSDIPLFIEKYSTDHPTLDTPSFTSDTEIWPALYQLPLVNGRIGVDLYTNPIAKDILDLMIEFQDNYITPRFTGPNNEVLVLALQPVFKDEVVIGCISRDINIGDYLDSIFRLAIDKVDRRTVGDDLARELLTEFNDVRFRAYIVPKISDEFILYDLDQSVAGDVHMPSQDFLDTKGETFEYVDRIDDNSDLYIICKSDIKIDNTDGLLVLLVLIFATCAISCVMFVWSKLLSQRKNALDIAIVQSEHKSKFVSEMSHEFRTPLNGIMGMMDLIKSEQASGIVKKYMGIVESCSSIMLSLVNDILDFSKIEAGCMKIIRCTTCIRTILKETVSVMRVTYCKKDQFSRGKVSLILKIDKSVPEGYSEIDDVRVRQIIVNLMSNALKFTNNGNVTLTVGCRDENVDEGDSRLYCSVTDTGIGMSQEAVSKLFRPFSQVHDAREVKAGGTGLGLVICKRLCESMGGSITCESVEGKGTTFSFDCVFGKPEDITDDGYYSEEWDLSIPVELCEDEYIVDSASKSVSEDVGACFTRRSGTSTKPSIIIADDVNINRLLLDRMLENINADIHFAKDGMELVTKCTERKFSLILSDVQMPIMSGAEAMRLISTGTGPNCDTPIISVSGSTHEEGTAVDKIMKPVVRSVLYEKLAKWLCDEEITWIHENWEKKVKS